jgi:hypothetical protein
VNRGIGFKPDRTEPIRQRAEHNRIGAGGAPAHSRRVLLTTPGIQKSSLEEK